MRDLDWRRIDREELAALLDGADAVAASAVGEATVYRLAGDRGDRLAIALPGGAALLIEKLAPPAKKRRRAADASLSPASR